MAHFVFELASAEVSAEGDKLLCEKFTSRILVLGFILSCVLSFHYFLFSSFKQNYSKAELQLSNITPNQILLG